MPARTRIGFRLPESYLRVRRTHAKRELALDWRKLGSRCPPNWPGSITIYSANDAERENASLNPRLDPPLKDRVYVIGTNTAGILYAIDHRGRVISMEECALEDTNVLATSFDEFETAFVVSKEAQSELRQKDRASELRGMPRRWKKIDQILLGELPHFRREAAHAMLIDVCFAYHYAGRDAELAAELKAFRKRHPSTGPRLIKRLREDRVPVGITTSSVGITTSNGASSPAASETKPKRRTTKARAPRKVRRRP